MAVLIFKVADSPCWLGEVSLGILVVMVGLPVLRSLLCKPPHNGVISDVIR